MPQGNKPELGINSWLEDELYHQYQFDRGSVDEGWTSLFGEFAQNGGVGPNGDAEQLGAPTTATVAAVAEPPQPPPPVKEPEPEQPEPPREEPPAPAPQPQETAPPVSPSATPSAALATAPTAPAKTESKAVG